jgi:hypothetical protein
VVLAMEAHEFWAAVVQEALEPVVHEALEAVV